MTRVEEDRSLFRELDLTGLSCPVPIVMTSETVKKMRSGEILKVVATDPGFERDIWNWSKQTGNELVKVYREKDRIVAYIRKTADAREPSLGYWIRFHAASDESLCPKTRPLYNLYSYLRGDKS